MIVRELQSEDIMALSKLYYQFWNEDSDIQKMADKFDQLQNNSSYILICAEENGILLGSLMGIIYEELYGDCKPFLVVENMVVDSAHRKKGVGKALFTELEERAKNKGCSQIILITESERNDACGFYESIGFHPTANKGYKKKI